MKKKPVFALALLLIVMSIFGVTACGDKSGEVFLSPAASASVKVDEENKTMTVEARVTASIPQAAVTDKEGNILSDYTVTRTVTKPDGSKSPATVILNHGDELTVKYTAVKGEEKIEKTYALKCYDTILPTLSFINLSRTYTTGAEISLAFNEVSDDLDGVNSTVTLKNVTTGEEIPVSITDGYTFTSTEAGEYVVTAALKDLSGNENTIVKEFKVIAPFTDENVDDHCIWDFNEEGYLANVAFGADGDVADMSIVDDTDGETQVKALKIAAKAGETYDITFKKGNTLRIYEQEYVTVRLRSEKVVDILEVYNADDGTMYDLSWKTGAYDGYTTALVPIAALFNEGYELDTLRIKLSLEADSDVYIDYIGYADPEPIFTDDDLPDNMLAAFDEAGYAERLSAASGKDHTTFNSTWEYVSADSAPAGANKGAIKFTSMTDPSTTSDGQARDGFTYKFNKRLKGSDFKNFAFRIYCEDDFGTLTLSFNDRKKGDTPFIWVADALAVKGEWLTVKVPASEIEDKLGKCENIVSVCVRFLRRAQAPEGAVLYVDGISNVSATYADFDYNFSGTNDADFYSASSLAGATVIGIVGDAEAKDGYALKAKTAFGNKSGVKISFNDIDVSGYDKVLIRLRTENPSNQGQSAVDLSVNGTSYKYANYLAYTTVDLKAALTGNTLSSVEIARTSVAGIYIYVDSITFLRPIAFDNVNYDFSSESDCDAATVFEYNGGETYGIVADSAATGGYAFKASTSSHGGNVERGISIAFNNVDLSAYEKIIVRLRTEGNAISMGANGKGYIGCYGNYASYTDVNILNYAAKLTELGITRLDSIEIYRNVTNITIYIDSITFVEKTDYTRVNYDFSSADDYDFRTVSPYGDGTVSGIVADSAATDGFALKAATGNNGGVKISFDNVDLGAYIGIIVRLRTEGAEISIGANGRGYIGGYGKYGTYTDVNILDYAAKLTELGITRLDSIEIYRNVPNITICVDSIKLVKKPDPTKVNYDFSKIDDDDLTAVLPYNKGTVYGIVADSNATGGFALKAATALNGGVKIAFNDLTISDYVSIKVRIRTHNTANPQVTVSMNGGKALKWSGFADYDDVDIIELFNTKKASDSATYNDTVLSSIEIWRDSIAGTEIWIDSITFEKWSEIDYSFSSADDKDMIVVSKYSDGTVDGIVADSAATDGFALKAVTGNNGGVMISFNNLNVSDYESITLRIRTETTASSPQINVSINDASIIEWKQYTEYTDVDILAGMKNKNIETLSAICLYRNVPNITIYVDSITFEMKKPA